MPNKTIKDDTVKWPSKKKYPCKRGEGEHEWGEIKIIDGPYIRYIHKEEHGILYTKNFNKDGKLVNAELVIHTETYCKHCGHKAISFLTDNLK